MQDKSKKNESAKKVQTKDNALNSEMKEALNIQINESMNFTPAEELALVEFINAIGETRSTKEIPNCVEYMLNYLADKPDSFQFEIQKQLDVIYRKIDDEPKNFEEIYKLLEKTGLEENHPEYLRARTMIHFLED